MGLFQRTVGTGHRGALVRVGKADDRPDHMRERRDEVRYALASLEEKIFVAEYQVRLPTAERIKERLQELADESDDEST